MEAFGGLTTYDLVVLGIFAALIARGLWIGLLKQLTSLLALYLGYFAASQYHDRLLPVLRDISDNPKVLFLTAYIILFIATYLVVMLLGKLLSLVINMTLAGWFDRLLGAVVGFAKAAIIVILIHLFLGTILAPENPMLRGCATCDVLNGAAEYTRTLIRDEEARKALMQQRPAISLDALKDYLAPPVQGSGSDAGKTSQ
ncbi:MAG: CvpA family protein [Desulforhopalus sp.]|jgi:membrane protein required for colicin V production|nr:CvpA family protein [Desulforhopalus sp.]